MRRIRLLVSANRLNLHTAWWSAMKPISFYELSTFRSAGLFLLLVSNFAFGHASCNGQIAHDRWTIKKTNIWITRQMQKKPIVFCHISLCVWNLLMSTQKRKWSKPLQCTQNRLCDSYVRYFGVIFDHTDAPLFMQFCVCKQYTRVFLERVPENNHKLQANDGRRQYKCIEFHAINSFRPFHTVNM